VKGKEEREKGKEKEKERRALREAFHCYGNGKKLDGKCCAGSIDIY